MNLHQAFQIFISYFAVEREKIAVQKVEEICKSENLDIFSGVEENCQSGEVYYSTLHGFRSLDSKRRYLNQFVVTNKGVGFSRARNLPYIYLPATEGEPSKFFVECPCVQATTAGYAQPVKLPYAIAGKIDEYPEGTMIVRITEDNQEAATFGYANAIPLLYQKDNIYIQRIDMLDTEYAAMLVDELRF